MAQQLGQAVEKATAPFQYALSTRAGVDCVALMVRLLTDMDEDTTVASLDGVGSPLVDAAAAPLSASQEALSFEATTGATPLCAPCACGALGALGLGRFAGGGW